MYRAVNTNFFKKWSPEMAYVLGFFAADGSMLKNNRGAHFIEFHITDRELLYAIRVALGSNHKIAVRDRHNEKWKIGYRLQIGSKEIYSDLKRLGFSQAKSKTLHFPAVPKKHIRHFVRGYFDGDGNVYFKQHWAKDRNKMRWHFTSRFTCGSHPFLISLLALLRKNGVEGGFILKKERGYELVFSHRDSLALYALMYNNVSGSLFLKRKHNIFQKAIATLYPKPQMRP